MPQVFQFYFRHVALGFLAATVFIGLILYFNVANLWHLISGSDVGWLALLVFWVLNGSVFAGVQFGIALMRMEEKDEGGPGTGSPDVGGVVPVPAKAQRP